MDQKVSIKNKPLTLVGRKIFPDTFAPEFKVFSDELKEFSLKDFSGKINIIHSFPSIDTEVCDLQVKEFNKRALELSDEINILGISKDLPFAQKRFCKEFKIDRIKTFSDYKTSSFGINYGLLIKELNLLARGAMIIDKDGILRYIQISSDLSKPLDFTTLFQKVKEVAKAPTSKQRTFKYPEKCLACEGKAKPLAKDEINQLFKSLNNWTLIEDKKIQKEFLFKDFVEAKYFLDLLSVIAEENGHHPSFVLIYNKLKVGLTTHAIGGLSNNDIIMAKIIDQISS
jgi:thioredoxin-dependent peroxiredoxin